MIFGDGIVLKYGGCEFTSATLDLYPHGLHNPQPVIPCQSRRCCEFDHILAYLHLLPFKIERVLPFTGAVWFDLLMMRWEYMGPVNAAIETSIRLVACNPMIHYEFNTIGDAEGVFDGIGRDGFGFEPPWLNVRFEVVYNRFRPKATAPLRLRTGHHMRYYRQRY